MTVKNNINYLCSKLIFLLFSALQWQTEERAGPYNHQVGMMCGNLTSQPKIGESTFVPNRLNRCHQFEYNLQICQKQYFQAT